MSTVIKRPRVWLLAAALGCAFAPAASAEIYKWVDAQGVVNYSNYPPPANLRGVRVVPEGNISVVPSSRISPLEAQALTDRMMARQDADTTAAAPADISSPSLDEPRYYPRAVNYPYGRPAGPYGIGAQSGRIQGPLYRELPAR